MKRIPAVALALVMIIGILAACGNGTGPDTTNVPPPQTGNQGATTPGGEPTPPPAGDSARGGRVTIGIHRDVVSLYPPELRSPADIQVSHFVLENILGFDATGVPEPCRPQIITKSAAVPALSCKERCRAR